uniref:Uncharacterized protein n=2 Tax=Arundo donax TaxID=35708 RepID=A0A0A9DKF8_ARUDO
MTQPHVEMPSPSSSESPHSLYGITKRHNVRLTNQQGSSRKRFGSQGSQAKRSKCEISRRWKSCLRIYAHTLSQLQKK